MEQISRRSLCKNALGSVLTLSLLETLHSANAFSAAVRPVINKWVADLDALGRNLIEKLFS